MFLHCHYSVYFAFLRAGPGCSSECYSKYMLFRSRQVVLMEAVVTVAPRKWDGQTAVLLPATLEAWPSTPTRLADCRRRVAMRPYGQGGSGSSVMKRWSIIAVKSDIVINPSALRSRLPVSGHMSGASEINT
jgi:hypothetical protein